MTRPLKGQINLASSYQSRVDLSDAHLWSVLVVSFKTTRNLKFEKYLFSNDILMFGLIKMSPKYEIIENKEFFNYWIFFIFH